MYLNINTSRARKTFKRLIGHTNHYLITILVGLDYVQKNDVILAEDFRTTWNPQNKLSSVNRSRDFSINSTLSWGIDALDAYLGLSHKKPSLYQIKDLYDKASGAGQSISFKFNVIKDYLISNNSNDEFEKTAALVEVAIQWRNNLVHYFAENEITKETEDTLLNNSEFYFNNFQGLYIQQFLEHFKDNITPRFKEVTSIIRGLHKVVEAIDCYLLNVIDKELYFIETLDYHIHLNTKNTDLKSKLGLMYNLNCERRYKSIIQSMMNYGFFITEEVSDIKLNWIEIISELSFTKAYVFLI